MRVKDVFLLGLVFTLWGCSASSGLVKQESESKSELVEEGNVLWSQGKPLRAVEKYEVALVEYESLELRRSIGEAALDGGDYTKAVYYLGSLLKAAPEDTDLRESFAIALLKQGDLAAAEQQFLAVFAKAERRPKTLNYLGVLSDLDGNSEKAERFYLSAIDIQPDDAMVMNNYGFSLMMRKEYTKAENWLLRARELGRLNERVVNNLSILYARQCRYDEALEIGVTSMDEAQVLNNIGYIALLNHDYRAAILFFQKAMDSSPTYNPTAAKNLHRAEKALDASDSEGKPAC